MNRCGWAKDALMIEYHDKEWGIPIHDDRKLFEMLILEGAQAGLTWLTVLKRRENYCKAFDNFIPHKVSKYNAKDISQLLKNAGIIRNKLKIKSAINNAKRFLEIQKEFGSFDKYLWGFVDYKPIINNYKNLASIPPSIPLSDKLSKDLKNRGFSFVGSTICYAFLQSVGVVNDHLINCFTRKK
ncbi:MAG: DNA-3-methyladenine glycosylase I [Nitrosopumilales archaeon]|nr:DNA-3-methyladenine glycosylase I [Nitrosopumilales archaeon]